MKLRWLLLLVCCWAQGKAAVTTELQNVVGTSAEASMRPHVIVPDSSFSSLHGAPNGSRAMLKDEADAIGVH